MIIHFKNIIRLAAFFTFFLSGTLLAMGDAITLNDSLTFLKSRLPDQFPENATINLLHEIAGISFYTKEITDEEFKYLAPLCELYNLKRLDFQCHNLNGQGLKIIAEKCGTWESVNALDLGANPLVEENLAHLKVFPNLQHLNIDFHRKNSNDVSLVNGDFLRTVKFEHLIFLEARGINISDDNALSILIFPKLEAFNFYDTPLEESTLQRLREEIIDFTIRSCWDLRRVKFQAKYFLRSGLQKSNEFNPTGLIEAYKEGLVTQAAYDWLLDNSYTISYIYPSSESAPKRIGDIIK